jgi:hypothetical protein
VTVHKDRHENDDSSDGCERVPVHTDRHENDDSSDVCVRVTVHTDRHEDDDSSPASASDGAASCPLVRLTVGPESRQQEVKFDGQCLLELAHLLPPHPSSLPVILRSIMSLHPLKLPFSSCSSLAAAQHTHA